MNDAEMKLKTHSTLCGHALNLILSGQIKHYGVSKMKWVLWTSKTSSHGWYWRESNWIFLQSRHGQFRVERNQVRVQAPATALHQIAAVSKTSLNEFHLKRQRTETQVHEMGEYLTIAGCLL